MNGISSSRIAFLFCLIWPSVAWAGMPMVMLTDLGRMRIQVISFFLVVFLISAWGIQALWNRLGNDFAILPQISYRQSLGIVTLWGLLFILILTMISGARELMTPGAWEKEGLTYRLKKQEEAAKQQDSELNQQRKEKLYQLRSFLMAHAQLHKGSFPPSREDLIAPPAIWEAPGPGNLTYHYRPGLTVQHKPGPLVYEPDISHLRWVLLSNGKIQKMTSEEITQALTENAP